MILYFAYGSCMHEKDFQDSVSVFERWGKAILKDRKIAFTHWSGRRDEPTGVADIVKLDGHDVEGILYAIEESYLPRLRNREGYPYVYSEEHVSLIYKGKMIDNVLTYSVVNKSKQEYIPSEEYARLILEGGKEELSETYLKELHDHITWLRNGHGIRKI